MSVSGQASLLLEESGDFRFGRVFDQVNFNLSHEGPAAEDVALPVWPTRGDCGAEGCRVVQYSASR